jgi:uncharacterized membrane protein YhhN
MTLWQVGSVMVLPVLGLLAADVYEARAWTVVCKPVASALFVLAGTLFLPLSQPGPRLLLLGLGLAFIGDVLLIRRGRHRGFLLGLGCFLGTHVAYSSAFLLRGAQWPGLLAGAGLMLAAAVPLWRWLRPHATGSMRRPIFVYVVALSTMVTLAAGACSGGAGWALMAGALLFYAGDIAVARERFVQHALWNGLIGRPLYYAAQLLLVAGMSS